MDALVYDDFQTPPELRTVPDPTPPAKGVVLEVAATGLCRSDWHGWMGHDPMIDVPNVPGHEVAGVVVDVGPEVESWSPGSRVTVPFVGGCGTCSQCAAGHQQVCPNQFQPGFTSWGSFAEYVAIDYADTNLVHLPEELDPVTAASLGCRFATSFRAVVDQGDVSAGDWVAVHGCGGIGLSAVMIADAVGAQVVAVDIDDEALSLATQVGATTTLHAREVDDVVAAVREYTNGGGHVSIDALGSPETSFNSVANLRRRGTHVQVGLMVDDHRHSPIPMDRVIAEELTVLGTHGMQAHRYPALLDMVQNGTLQPEKLIQNTISLSEAGSALTTMDENTASGVTVVDTFS